MKQVLIIAGVVILVMNSFAEFRIWENTSGEIWEAEFVTMKGKLVLLRDQGGGESEYAPSDLSQADRDYLDEKLPPVLDINVSKTTDDSISSSKTKVTCNASVKQADTREYHGELTLVLLVIGEDVRTGSLSRLNKTEKVFTLPEQWGESVELSSAPTAVFKNNAKSGRIYAGYVAVVWDRFGNAIAVETNKSSLEERAEKMAYVSLKNRKSVK